MSTKIWTAHRIPLPSLNRYLELCRDKSLKKFFATADWQLNCIDWKQAVKRARENKYIQKVTGHDIRRYAVELLEAEYRKANQSWDAGLFDVECGLNIWLEDAYAYIIPVGRTVVLPKVRWAKDYSYQNQVDRPKHIPAKEYAERKKTWERLCLNNWNVHRLYYQIVDFSAGSVESSFELERHFGLWPSAPGNNDHWQPFRKGQKIT
jgi:hypothetical protein